MKRIVERMMSTLVVGVLAMAAARPAAAVLTVTNTNDSGAGSLRDAIASGNGQTIVFDAGIAGKTITLTSGPLVVAGNMTIDGTGSRIAVSGNHASAVLQVNPWTVSIKGLTIRDGASSAGGGIVNFGILTLEQVWVTENTTPNNGAGIRNDATLTVRRSTVSGNAAGLRGGGIYVNDASSLVLESSTVSGNAAGTDGGGIGTAPGGSTVSVVFSTIVYNRAATRGGGIDANDVPANSVSFLGSLVMFNAAGTSSPDCSGTLSSGDYNELSSLSGCTLSGTTTHVFTTTIPGIGALQTNGAEPKTHAVLPGGAATDIVPSAFCTAHVTTDQRGYPRPEAGGSSCDVGAYEATKAIVVDSLLDPSEAGKCTLRDAIKAANTNVAQNGCTAGSAAFQDRIVFLPAATGRIRLTAGALVLTSPVMIDGRGATRTIVSGERASAVFDIEDAGGPGAYGLAGLTIANGRNAFGGGVYIAPGDDVLAVDRVAFEDDVATSEGGAIYAQGQRRLEIDGSTFSNTLAASAFDAIASIDMPAEITNTTVGETRSGNAAVIAYATAAGKTASVRLRHCTLAGREPIGAYALAAGGASAGSAVVDYGGSVFAGHGTDLLSVSGSLVSRGYNVIHDASGAAAATGDVKSTDPKLAAHVLGGGGTRTMGLLTGSPAIDRIPLTACFALRDQRGVTRPVDGDRAGGAACDAGAFEAPPPVVVNSLLDGSDAGKCTLRDALAAVAQAAAVNGCAAGPRDVPGLITFGVQGTINLAATLSFDLDVAIRGPGASKLTLSGQGARRIFDFPQQSQGWITITDLTLANGANGAAAYYVLSTGTLAFADTVFRNASGASIFAQNDDAVQVLRSTFDGATAGIVELINTNAVVESSTLHVGGSVSQALSNTASNLGYRSYVLVKSTTVNGSAPVGIGTDAQGGAAAGDALTEYAGTIVNGHATAFSGSGTNKSLGFNLASDATGGLTATGDKPSTNALLGPLGYHGGELPVFDLLPASPAKDAIPASACGPAVDERGVPRPFGAACDIGAVERVTGGDVNGDGVLTVADVFYLINFLFAGGPVPVGEADVNGDGAINVNDVFYLINRLFAGGPAPI